MAEIGRGWLCLRCGAKYETGPCPNCGIVAYPSPEERIAELEAERDTLVRATQFCEKCKPSGGTVSRCQRCYLIELSAALSRIDYACGEPNEMECSGYDVHYDPSLVVQRVKSLRAENERLREGFTELPSEFGTAIAEMAQDLDMTPAQVIKQAIRGYQLEWAKARGKIVDLPLMVTDEDLEAALRGEP